MRELAIYFKFTVTLLFTNLSTKEQKYLLKVQIHSVWNIAVWSIPVDPENFGKNKGIKV